MDEEQPSVNRKNSISKIITGMIAVIVPVIGLFTAIVQIPSVGNLFAQYLLQGNQDVGLKAVFKQSNDFLSSEKGRLKEYIQNSKDEIWLSGTSFYISVPQYEETILQKLKECVSFTFIILNPESDDYINTAKSMGYTPERLTYIVKEGISALVELDKKRKLQNVCSRFSVWLTKRPFSSRIYMFDPGKETGSTYLVPQVYGKDSTRLPGFLLSNAYDRYHLNYLNGMQELTNEDTSITLSEWLKKNPTYLGK